MNGKEFTFEEAAKILGLSQEQLRMLAASKSLRGVGCPIIGGKAKDPTTWLFAGWGLRRFLEEAGLPLPAILAGGEEASVPDSSGNNGQETDEQIKEALARLPKEDASVYLATHSLDSQQDRATGSGEGESIDDAKIKAILARLPA